MKKLILILILIINWQLSIDNCYAQAPNSFSYQAVVRNNSGVAMPNQLVNFRISILQGSTSGTSVYTETKQLTTSSGGLADFQVGTGTIVSGTMAAINWGANTHFLKIELDATGGNSFALMGTSQLMSVPYALDAKKAEGLQLPLVVYENNNDPLLDITNTGAGEALRGESTHPSAFSTGVLGVSQSSNGVGVRGSATSATGTTIGVEAYTLSPDGVGISAVNTSPTGTTKGVSAQTYSTSGTGVLGEALAATGNTIGVSGSSASPNGAGGSFTNTATGGHALITQQGAVKIGNLSGTGSRMVVAGTDGTLNTQALPSSQWTTNGNDISNTNTGNVGIGSLATTISKLNVSNSTNSNGIASYTYVNGSSAIAGRAVADNSYGVIGQALNNASTGVYGLADNANSVGVLAIAPNATSIGLSANSGFGTAGEFYTQTGTGLHVNAATTGKAIIVENGKSGFGEPNPQEKLDVAGAVKIGNTTTNNAGTIKYDGTDLQGYVGGQWKSLTSGGANYTAGSGIAISGSNVISTIPQTLSIATNQLTLSNGGGTVTLPSTTYTAGTGITVAGSVVSALNTSNIWNANKLQGNNVSATAPTNGQSLVWNNTSSQWEPQTVSGGSSPFSTNGNNAYLTNLSSGTLSVGSNASLPTFKSTIYSDVDNPNGMYISANSGNGIAMMTTGRVGINTLTPYTDAVLDVNGSMYIRGGNPAAGKVLTSNADGKASWQTPTGGVNYTAGTGINISGGNVISATAPTYTAGTGIDITGGTISSNLTAGTGINISGGTVSTNLTAGSGISITGNTISATGSATGGWNKTGANVSLQTSTDYVGIGTAGSAGAKLRIAGGTDAGISVTASGSFNNAIFANVVGTDAVAANLLAASGAKGLVVSSTDANAAQFFSQNSASINVNPTTSTSKIAIVVPFDNSGFGTTTPTDKVHIVGGTSLRYEDGNQAAGKVLTSDANGRASWQTPTGGGGGGSSPWTVTGNDINNSNTGKVLVAEATGTTGAKFEVANNPGGGFGKVAAISTTSNYMTALEVTESSTSGNPAATVGSTGAAAIKASATFGDALFANSTNGRGIFLKGGSTNYPAMKIENNVNATTSLEMDGQIKINGGAPGAGKVLTSDANGLATWQTPSGGGGGGATGWGLTGNSGNSPTTNFIGNTDAVDLVMKTNNVAGLVLTSGGAILASGNTTTGTTPAIGAGTRMMWIPNRAAFRAGAVNGTQWNDINIGFNSAAFGNNCIASGMNSFAAGNSSSAGSNSAISMGSSCSASSSNTVALGNLVSVNQLGAFCFGDQEFANTLMPSTSNEMSMRFKGGYRLFTTSATTGGSAIGVTLAAGGNSWAQISDVRRKENFVPVNGEDFLNKIAKFNLTSWNYKGQDAKSFRHYGPMAQDFYAAFGNDQLGTIGNDTTITSGDFDGINFIAIQALEKRTSDLNNANIKLQQENKMLLESIENMKAEMSSQKAELNKKFEMLEAIIENSKIDKNEFITNNR